MFVWCAVEKRREIMYDFLTSLLQPPVPSAIDGRQCPAPESRWSTTAYQCHGGRHDMIRGRISNRREILIFNPELASLSDIEFSSLSIFNSAHTNYFNPRNLCDFLSFSNFKYLFSLIMTLEMTKVPLPPYPILDRAFLSGSCFFIGSS